MIALFSGCSSGSNNELSSKIDSLSKQVSYLEDENEKLKQLLKETNVTVDETTEESNSPTSEDQSQTTNNSNIDNLIELTKPFTVEDYAKLKLKSVEFASKIAPPNPDSFYSYYEVKDSNNIYLDTVINIKSLLTSAKSSDEFVSVKVKYDEKYDYNSFSTVEENGGTDFTYTNITSIEPLKSKNLHFIAELPVEASKDTKSLSVIITCDGKDFIYKLR
ncbi:hypothetical protein RE628_15870 [Paenibacillus sp. D2_2]|uniref:hypothetical protein n=1 Tax=Paenibacillus sp. D2_2 TaxID=3073092 RepID=UPI002815260F|nr:hypothetical protein [Paenibacillus sp. D2_2]WMT38999.1 hypothetical protein RE628_15870 [Paenibacillus sp. D2_2]